MSGVSGEVGGYEGRYSKRKQDELDHLNAPPSRLAAMSDVVDAHGVKALPREQVGGGLEEQFAAQTGHFLSSCQFVVDVVRRPTRWAGILPTLTLPVSAPAHHIEGGERNR